MPTAIGGLPRRGEVWERRFRFPPGWELNVVRFVVLERSGGDYWSLRVFVPGKGRQLLVDPAYWLSRGELSYVGPAGPQTRKKLGLS